MTVEVSVAAAPPSLVVDEEQEVGSRKQEAGSRKQARELSTVPLCPFPVVLQEKQAAASTASEPVMPDTGALSGLLHPPHPPTPNPDPPTHTPPLAAAEQQQQGSYCMMTSGSMLKRRSSLSLRTSSRRAVSSCSASCRSDVVSSGRPFSFTMTSPSLMPPLFFFLGGGWKRQRLSKDATVNVLEGRRAFQPHYRPSAKSRLYQYVHPIIPLK